MKIDLKELEDAEVISSDTAYAIREYYRSKSTQSPNRLVIAFSILGAVLVGLGIILIVAHNWDQLSRGVKTALSFVPLIIGQFAVAYALFRAKQSIAWSEASGCFLTFALGACIALISQVYHIEGDLSEFLFTWSVLILPIVYLLRSGMVSLIYMVLITYYLVETGYGSSRDAFAYRFWVLWLANVPFLYFLFKERKHINFIHLHSVILPISLSIGVGSLSGKFTPLSSIAFMSLFGLIYGFGHLYRVSAPNGFSIYGSLATMFLLYLSSFENYWAEMNHIDWTRSLFFAQTFYAALFCFLLALGFYVFFFKINGWNFRDYLRPIMTVFVLYSLIFVLGQFMPGMAQGLINLFILGIGIFILKQGASVRHLGMMNYGLALISILVICRFFDTDMSFVWRGLIFIALGFGFFAANYRMIQYRKKHEI